MPKAYTLEHTLFLKNTNFLLSLKKIKNQWVKYGNANKILKVKFLLSKNELEFLKSPESFNANYAYGIKHRLNCKVKAIQEEMGLLQKSGFLNLTEFNKNLTDFNKITTENRTNQNCDQSLN